MSRNEKKVIVLELDGATDSVNRSSESGFSAVDRLAQARLGVSGLRERCRHAGPLTNVKQFFEQVLSDVVPELTGELVAEFTDCFQQHEPESEVSAETIKILSELRQVGLLALLADGPILEQKAKCLSAGLASHVNRIVFPDYWGCGFRLPHPRALMSIQNCYGIEPGACTLVGGGQGYGLAAASRLGWRTVRITASGLRRADEPIDDQIASVAALFRTIADEANAA